MERIRSGMDPGKPCPFCNPRPSDIIARNELCYARYDRFPVSRGHLLIIPFRHARDLFSMTMDERVAMLGLVDVCRELVDARHHPDGYNIGVNIGDVAGQSVLHSHCHMIPRYRGEGTRPGGGIRGVVPRKRVEGD